MDLFVVGNLRWRAPETPKVVTSVQQATTQPNECFQSGSGSSAVDPFRTSNISKRAVSQDEDCLFLKYVRADAHCVAPTHLLLQCVHARTTQPIEETSGARMDTWRRVSAARLLFDFCLTSASYGAGAASQFSGTDLVRESGFGIVAVIIQYRLGVFGKPRRFSW
jgi:hypothetical protein